VILLPSSCGLAKSEFPVKELLWNAVVMLAGDVTCPSQLGLAYDGDGTGKVCLPQDFCVLVVSGTGTRVSRVAE